MPIKIAFQSDIVTLNVADIIPTRSITSADRRTDTYQRIATSIKYVGIIEPLVVLPATKGQYVLEGNTRLDILVMTNTPTVKCLLATANDAYTYNKRVNYIPPIAQHHMILKALEHVSEERIASVLNLSVAAIRAKRDLLNGICPEAVEILRNERVGEAAFAVLRRMKPLRQIDVAHLMVSAHKFTGSFARALLDGTREEFLVSPLKPPVCDTTAEQRAMIEQETEDLLKHFKSIQESYGNDVLNLTTSCCYVRKLLANSRVRRYLTKHHPDTLAALEQLLSDIAVDKQRKPPSTTRSTTGRQLIPEITMLTRTGRE